MSGPRKAIGDYLAESQPAFALWQHLLRVVFTSSSGQADLSCLSPSARVVYLVRMFGGQASNGGLHQFLTNASGDFTTETLEALWLARADISAGLLARALSLFPRGV